jgi:biotin carboxyl carrier protein
VWPLERAVTPFSEYKLRLGIGLMIEDGIQPKTPEAVRKWVNGGGKLKVGGDVLVGLKRWETLVPKTPEADKLLENMKDELDAALASKAKLVGPADLPASFTTAQKHTALGYQQKGFDLAAAQAKGTDLSPLLLAPQVLHGKPRALEAGSSFQVLLDPSDSANRAEITFTGFGKAPNGDITINYLVEDVARTFTMPDPDAAVAATGKSGPRKATPGDPNELPTIVPGELLSYSVKPGDILKAGEPLCVLESMKMEMKISVPPELDGKEVKACPVRGRTKTDQGELLQPGDLLLEVADAKA